MPYQLTEITELRAQRRKLGEDVRALYAKAKAENARDLTPEESTQVDRMIADGEAIKTRHERMERADGLLENLNAAPDTRQAPAVDPEIVAPAGAEAAAAELRNAGRGPRDSKEYRELFRQFLCAQDSGGAFMALQRAQAFLASARESRDLQTDVDTQAGYLVPPEQLVLEIIKELDDQTMLRQFARTFTVRQAKSLGAPKRTAKASTWKRGAELGLPTKDTALKFGKRQLFPNHASGEIVVSRDFLRGSLINAEQYVREEIARDGAEFLEKEYLTGNGADEGLGVYTPSAEGISTARDVSAGNTTTAVTVAGLRNAKYSIKPPYWPRLRWVGSREFHKQIYGLSDTTNRPLFVESLKVGELDRVLGFPIVINEFNPSTFTASQYVAILGDWSFYWIADALDMELQRLDELYARSNQVGFLARLKTDSMPVLEECWARVQLAAS